MATCRTCGKEIEVPDGWAVGPAVRRHYWAAHAERMQRTRADRAAGHARATRHPSSASRSARTPRVDATSAAVTVRVAVRPAPR